MSASPLAPALRAPGLASALGVSRARGLRVSAARRRLLAALCGAREAFEPRRIDAARAVIERELGFRAQCTHLPIAGVCAACQNKENGHAHS